MTRKARRSLIRTRALYFDYLATMYDPASQARRPTTDEREEFAVRFNQAASCAAADWVARHRGIR
jgi:hypothetical protein